MTKKIKEPPVIDYMKLPDHIWEKVWTEFQTAMSEIDYALFFLEKRLTTFEKACDAKLKQG